MQLIDDSVLNSDVPLFQECEKRESPSSMEKSTKREQIFCWCYDVELRRFIMCHSSIVQKRKKSNIFCGHTRKTDWNQ